MPTNHRPSPPRPPFLVGFAGFFLNHLVGIGAGVTAQRAVVALADAWDASVPGPLLLVPLLGLWLGFGIGLSRWQAHLWERGRRWTVVGLLAAELACLPLLLFAAFVGLAEDWQRFEKTFGPHAAEYMAMTPAGDPDGDDHLRGHAVLVEDRAGRVAVDNYHMAMLPRPIRAESLAEVGSVVQLRWGRRDLPEPPGAWSETCEVTVLDADSRRVLARRTFAGRWREVKYKNRPKFWTGSLEVSEVTGYLAGLPRRGE